MSRWAWVASLARLVLAGVWLAAGALKLPDPAEGVRAVARGWPGRPAPAGRACPAA